MTGRILVVDDDKPLCETLAQGLAKRGYTTEWCLSAEQALRKLAEQDYDAVITDLAMKGVGGIELCERIVLVRRDIPVLVLTAFGSFETAVAAIRAGAYDFISKPVQLDVLSIALARAVQHRALRDELKRLREEVGRGPRFEALIGDSTAMQSVYRLIERVGDSESSVLITGESGTGKEVVARALHQRSRRSGGPFVVLNCAAMPEALLESELFGHTRGAFTDAKQANPGLFARAQGGTVFLDEIGDLPLGLQPKLLRVLQERTARALGAVEEVSLNVRFVAATNVDLESAIEEKRFREDLYFRINVIQIDLPSLRARPMDILPLAQHFLSRYAARASKAVNGIAPAAAERLLTYSWPGNVRELQNCVERAVALSSFTEITLDDLPERIRTYRNSHVVVAAEDPSEFVRMEEVERRYILRVLDAVSGNKMAAARILGIERKTLYRKLERYGPPEPE